MLHEPAQNSEPDNAAEYKMKLGVYMFIIYALVYIGFVVINLYDPLLMEIIVCCGLNLAVVYGFGLIIFALVLALVYHYLCRKEEISKNIEGGC
jgi:uncharacterized membrane protein (DUF485 family)